VGRDPLRRPLVQLQPCCDLRDPYIASPFMSQTHTLTADDYGVLANADAAA